MKKRICCVSACVSARRKEWRRSSGRIEDIEDVADLFRRGEGEAVCKNRQLREERLLVLGKEIV